MTQEQRENCQRLVGLGKWKAAKTFDKYSPHEYVVKGEHLDVYSFLALHVAITTLGHTEWFKSNKRLYLVIGDYKYWYMDSIDKAVIINRASVGVYDVVAEQYGDLFKDEKSRLADKGMVMHMLSQVQFEGIFGRIADIGCGHSLILSHIPVLVSPDRYVGIDASQKMIEMAQKEFPEYKDCYRCMTAETWVETDQSNYDVILMTWGVMSYIEQQVVYRIMDKLNPGGVFYGSAYAPGYYPETYKRAGVAFSNIKANQYQESKFTSILKYQDHWWFTYKKP